MRTDLFSLAAAFGLAAGVMCAILIARWGWRAARQYLYWRDAIRRIRLTFERRDDRE